jgi:hypothetical protein
VGDVWERVLKDKRQKTKDTRNKKIHVFLHLKGEQGGCKNGHNKAT